MIISVVVLGGILLSATSIAGLLMVYQIRSVNDAVSSAKAVFAADAGIELSSWCFFKGCDDPSTPAVVEDATNPPPVNFDDPLVSLEINVVPTAGQVSIIARGYSAGGRTIRILETILE